MARLLKVKTVLEEGEFFNKWVNNRIKNNKNILGSITGPTGSGKTYTAISMLENYYKNILHKPFPVENICFSLDTIARRLNSGELKAGEILILEEGGALLGNLDFQQKLSKMFTYILQSFRSLNIGLIITLPVLSMLNKQARLLIHFHFITASIDFEKKICKIKPYFHQLNQQSGKSFWKFPRVRIHKNIKKINKLSFTIPSKEILIHYELEKSKFVSDITQDFIEECDKKDRKKKFKEERKEMTEKQLLSYNLACEGLTQTEIGEKLGITNSAVSRTLKAIKMKGYEIKLS